VAVNKSGIQAQIATAAFETMVGATVPYCLKILDGARDLATVNTWANRRRGMGGGLLILRTVTGDGVQISDMPALTARTLSDFAGWAALATGGVHVVLEAPINEKFTTDPAEFAALAEATDHFVEAATDAGFWAGVLVTSEGNPPGENDGAGYFLQPRVLAMLRKWRQLPLRKPGKRVIWCPHGYSHPPTPANDAWHFDRPAHILAQLPEDARLNYAFGEMGCDGGCDLPDKKPGVGYEGYFAPEDGRIKRYAEWARPQVAAVAADPLCIGGAFFLSGADPNGSPNFTTFDVRDEVDFRPVLTEAVPGPPITWLEPVGVPTVPDIALSVPTRTAMASPENYRTGPRARTIGVVIHTTRGGGRPETEFSSTIAWFQNPDAQVSAHLVVGHTPFDEVARCVHDDDVAWHCREANATHLGIEICQAQPTDPLTDFQYRAAAEACRLWATKYGFPLARVTSQNTPGLVGHEDTEAGKRDHKSDPGPAFDWPRFLKLVRGGTPVPTPPTDTLNVLRDETYGHAHALRALKARWQAAGYPQTAEGVDAAGNAAERFVSTSKGER
jgi:N-acetyl-anhydromuramyl-L-alanine amidase AmpD